MNDKLRRAAALKEIMMKLYYSPGACSLSPHIVAMEAGIALEIERVDLRAKKTQSGADFPAINPKGYVPALDIGGAMLTEGPAIVQYLADLKPQSGLAPANGTMERYRLQEMLNFISTELHKTIGGLFNPAMQGDWLNATLALIDRRLGLFETMLQGKSYIMGETFTVADAYAFTVINWAKMKKIDLAKFPNVTAYMARVGARPKVIAAMKVEGLMN